MDFAPSVYEHAAALIDVTPWAASRDAELMFRAHAEAYRLYRHAPVVVGIDIYNLEAEAYGATIAKPTGTGIPAVSSPICAATEDILELQPFNPEADGRIPTVIEVGKRLAAEFPEADVRIPLSGPFSIASGLAGFDALLCDTLNNPATVCSALMHLVTGQIGFCREVMDQGLDIAFFESAAAPPMISPRIFADVELPALKAIIAEAAGIVCHPVPCIIGGDTTSILNSILETGTEFVICPCETQQRMFMRIMEYHPDVMVRVNMAPHTLTSNSAGTVCREIDRVWELARVREKACIGTGALPFEANPELVIKAREYVSQKSRAG